MVNLRNKLRLLVSSRTTAWRLPAGLRGARKLGPRHLAVGTIALITAAVTMPVVDTIGIPSRLLGDHAGARALVMMTTATLAAALGRAALLACSPTRARVWLALGAGASGAAAMWLSYVGVTVLRGLPLSIDAMTQVSACLGIGGALGFIFGTAFAPIVMVARRAVATPSHDGSDRVIFAAGVSLVLAALARVGLAGGLAQDRVAPLVIGGAGVMAILATSARIIARVRLVDRARRGLEPGFHLVPALGAEEDRELLPLVRLGARPAGILAATGVSAPYRGARGVFKLGLAPLPEERFDRPIASLVRAAFAEGAACIATLFVGAGTVLALSPFLCLACFAAAGGTFNP